MKQVAAELLSGFIGKARGGIGGGRGGGGHRHGTAHISASERFSSRPALFAGGGSLALAGTLLICLLLGRPVLGVQFGLGCAWGGKIRVFHRVFGPHAYANIQCPLGCFGGPLMHTCSIDLSLGIPSYDIY